MSGSARSTSGCWTCRLRKKKCDEGKPVCSTCNNLAIPCHRYGAKPEWMDGKGREMEMAETIRRVVKETTAEKKRIAMKRRLQRQQSDGFTSNTAAPELTSPAPPVSTLPSIDPIDLLSSQGERTINHVAPTSAASSPLSDTSIIPEEIDSELLMHYLDHVFPLQFPFYKPSVVAGGRGWLLSILTTTKPLYHTTISLAAYHRRSMLPRECAGKNQEVTLQCLERQYTRALSELRQYLASLGDKNKARTQVQNVNVVCCLAMLISLEMFKGDARNWKMHLSAAAVLITDIKSEERSTESSNIPSRYRSALFFFSSVVGWYDILSCSTTGKLPFSNCECLDAAMGYVFLEEIMGCENWVMLLIMDIAFLDNWKKNLQASAQLNMRELVSRATHIERRLKDGIRNNSSRLGQLTDNNMPSGRGTGAQEPSHLILLITRIFACSALVYLDVVVSGAYPEIPEIREDVSQTIDALRALPERAIIRNLTWAYCIAGCMAIEEEHKFFRDLAVSAAEDTPSFGNFSAGLAVVEECWRQRREGSFHQPFDWRTAMNSLGLNVLLV